MNHYDHHFRFSFADTVVIKPTPPKVKIGDVTTDAAASAITVAVREESDGYYIDFTFPTPDSEPSTASPSPITNSAITRYVNESVDTVKTYVDTSIDDTKSYVDTSVADAKSYVDESIETAKCDIDIWADKYSTRPVTNSAITTYVDDSIANTRSYVDTSVADAKSYVDESIETAKCDIDIWADKYSTRPVTNSAITTYVDDSIAAVTSHINESIGSVMTTVNELLADYGRPPMLLMSESDTAPALLPNRFYVFPTMTALTPTFTPSELSGITNEYRFRFTSGETPTVLTLPSEIVGTLTPEANRVYEVSVVDGYLLYNCWEV